MTRPYLGSFVLAAILSGCGSETAPPVEEVGVEPEAVQCLRRARVRGVDVSYYQGHVDWNAAGRNGVVFGFARVADGATFVDPLFAENWAAMREARVIRGTYQFFRPAQDPVAQADVLLREIEARGGLQKGDLPPALDIEVADGVAGPLLRSRARAWLDRVEAATGRTPILYTSPAFWDDLGKDPSFARYTLWVAHWETRCPTLPGDWERFRFWQDSEGSAVPGFGGPVDTDWFDGTRAELEAFAGGAPPPHRGKARPPARPMPRKRPRPRAAPGVLGGLLRALSL